MAGKGERKKVGGGGRRGLKATFPKNRRQALSLISLLSPTYSPCLRSPLFLFSRPSFSLTSLSLLLLFRCLSVSPGTTRFLVSGSAPPRILVSYFPQAMGSLCSPSPPRLPLSSPPFPPSPLPPAPPASRSPPHILPVTRGPPDKSLQGQPNFEGQDKASAYGPIPRCLSSFLFASRLPLLGAPSETLLLAARAARRSRSPPPSSAPTETWLNFPLHLLFRRPPFLAD